VTIVILLLICVLAVIIGHALAVLIEGRHR